MRYIFDTLNMPEIGIIWKIPLSRGPHKALGYKTPIEFACGKVYLSEISSSDILEY